ncbi:MAG: hypothetical protein VX475_23780 [Myxococcota bacterium]|nr:hypothetical protein [Myxococcota bacterium]
MTASESMGELRSALHEPSVESWNRAVELLTRWDGHQQLVEEVVPYAHDILSRWPDEVPRALPQNWQDSFFGNTKPLAATFDLMTLVSEISSKSMYSSSNPPTSPLKAPPSTALHLLAKKFLLGSKTPEDRLMWLAACEAPRLEAIGLMIYSFSKEVAKEWNLASWLGENLKTLDVIISDEVLPVLLEGKSLKGLTSISISGAEGFVQAAGLSALLDAARGAELTVLDCSDAWLGEDAARVLASHETLKSVYDLDLRYNAFMGSDGVEQILRSKYVTDVVKDDINDYYEDIFE